MRKFYKVPLVLCIFLASLCIISYAEDPIKLHIFLHSHLDEGWRYTFEHYYTGTGGQDGGCVKCAFDNVYESLKVNTDRKYMIAEVAFFNRWWKDQSQDHKDQYRKYLQQKQVEFINGGWSANDEACAYYEDIIDQFILGHRWLKNEFDLDSNIGWQIDSFGHSATHAAIMAQAGYDGLFFGRIDYQDWAKRRNDQTLEVNWRTQNPHNESIFTHVLYVHYSDTSFMIGDNYWCRSIFCNGPLSYNQVTQVGDWIRMQSRSFPTKNVAMLVGDDFHLWQGAEKDFNGIEKMIADFLARPDQKIIPKFSTLSEYVAEVQQDLLANGEAPSLPEKHGDFFPYIENEFTAWVGYYTSKSMFKLKVREVSQYYNAAKLLLAKFMLQNDKNVFELTETSHKTIDSALNRLEDPLAVVQHHDAISGTMKEGVKQDYYHMLKTGRDAVNKEIIGILEDYSAKLLGDAADYRTAIDIDWRQTDAGLTNIFSDNKKVLVNVFNPGEKDKFLVKIRVPNAKYKVIDETNNHLVPDIICHSQDSASDCFIYFVDEIESYTLKSYILQPSALSKVIVPKAITDEIQLTIDGHVSITVNKNLLDFQYSFCPATESFNINAMFTDTKCLEDSFNLNYEYYESYRGSGRHVSSGAYIFSPRTNDRAEFSPIKSGRVFKGRHITLIQVFREHVRTDLKLVHHELDKGIEIESFLDPVTNAHNGKEIVVMIRSKNVVNNDLVFYTDENGYYMQRRQINHRDDFTSSTSMPIPSNYYPINSAVYIEDSNSGQRLMVMTDRAQGVTVYKPGEVEIMIHRLTVQDDWKGLDETLNEWEPDRSSMLKVSTRHYLMYSSPANGFKSFQRKRQYKLDRPLQLWFANTNANDFDESASQAASKGLDLKNNVKLYIRSYTPHEYIVRLHNLDEELSKVIEVYDLESKLCSLLNVFAGRDDFVVSAINELALFTTKDKSEIKPNKLDPKAKETRNPNDGQDFSKIELVPMEIRTFKIVLQH